MLREERKWNPIKCSTKSREAGNQWKTKKETKQGQQIGNGYKNVNAKWIVSIIIVILII